MSDLNDEYSPDAIRFWLAGRCPRCRWAMLESAVEGGTGCSGMGSGRGKRLNLADVKADLERAADQLPTYWQSTEWIYRKQHRSAVFQQRRQSTPSVPVDQREPEHPAPSVALEEALYRMSRILGWSEGIAA